MGCVESEPKESYHMDVAGNEDNSENENPEETNIP